ncbi:MAG: SCO family protein [Flavobacteriales bacterium]|nr:SCO family protein [Flavobacteriales bacterium]
MTPEEVKMIEDQFLNLTNLEQYVQPTGDTLTFIKNHSLNITGFNLLNQEGQVFTQDSLKGKVWLAAFYSTDHPYVGKITKRLLWPNWKYRREDDINIICFSTNAAHDKPEVLKEYVETTTQLQPLENKWFFLTGDQDQINGVMSNQFGLEEIENTSAVFLVDAKGFIRGRYDGNRETEIGDAIEDIALLKKEMDIERYEKRKAAEK